MENASSGTSGGAGSGTEAGQVLAGRYRLGDVLGSGGMGRVWRARDEVLHRTVAIKELRAGLYASEADRAVLHARTQKEARAAARINHPGVVTVHDVLEHDDRPWIVMEYVDGPSLADALKNTGPCDAREAARIGLHVLGALRAAHAVGVLHRDVKPGNVMLARDGRVLLTDFGIAAIEGDSTITRTGELVGSLDYLAPERIRGEDPGPASDLWALGATLYTAVEESSPFRRTSPISTLQAVVSEDPAPSYNAGALAPVLVALLRKEPDERPDGAGTERMLLDARAGLTPRQAQPQGRDRQTGGESRRPAAPAPATTALPSAETGPAHRDGRTPAQGYVRGPAPPHSGQTSPGQPYTGQTHAGQTSPGQPYAGQTHAGQTSPGQPYAGQTHAGQTSPGQPYGGQTTPGQTYAGQTQSGYAPSATHPHPHPHPSRQARGKERGKAVLGVLAAALIGGGAVFGTLQLMEKGESGGSEQPSTTAGQQDPKQTPGGHQGTSPDPTGSGNGNAQVPAGWGRHTEKGFSLPVPDGWERTQSGTGQFDYSPDNGNHRIRINVDPNPDYDSPYRHLTELEVGLAKHLPEYQRLRLEKGDYRDRSSGLLEFTYTEKTDNPGKRYALDQMYFVADDGPEYAIYVSGPLEDRAKTRERFNTVLRGWRTHG